MILALNLTFHRLGRSRWYYDLRYFIGLLILALSLKVKQAMPSFGHRKKLDIIYYGRWMMQGNRIAVMWRLNLLTKFIT